MPAIRALEIWEAAGGFAQRLRGMMKLRGWRVRDSLVLFATLLVHLILAPPRFVLLSYSPPNSERSRWERRLDSLGYSPLLDCVVVSSDGLFRLRRGIDNIGLICDNHEPSARSVFQPTEGEIVVDVGAYIGSYALRASRLVGSQGKVIAVEAEPSNFDALLCNLKLNQADNVVPLKLAAWDREAVLDLHMFDDAGGHSLVYFPDGLPKLVKVRARPLDEVLAELGIGKVDWVKIDVQGAEVEVLRGLKKTIGQSPNLKLLVEVHSEEIRKECLTILEESGRQIQQISRLHLFASPISHPNSSTDYKEAGQNAT